MIKITTNALALQYATELKLSQKLCTEILNSVQLVECLLEELPSAQACLIILNAENELQQTLNEYGLSYSKPEITEDFEDLNSAWRKQVYIIDDSGDGIIYFYPLSPH